MIRWVATVFYRTDGGILEVPYDLEEIADLHNRIEHGPYWDTVYRIVITRVNPDTTLTVEGAAKL